MDLLCAWPPFINKLVSMLSIFTIVLCRECLILYALHSIILFPYLEICGDYKTIHDNWWCCHFERRRKCLKITHLQFICSFTTYNSKGFTMSHFLNLLFWYNALIVQSRKNTYDLALPWSWNSAICFQWKNNGIHFLKLVVSQTQDVIQKVFTNIYSFHF